MKAREVFERCQDDATLPDADIVIGADTVVVMDNDVLEKPRDEAHALAMLQRLSGQTHQVFTGVHIIYKSDSEVKQTGFVECTRVKFSEIDSDTMAAYIASGEPFGKAGSYGIQGTASLFVEWIHGDYWNVVCRWLT
ncbi:maf-like protein [Radiomyces spectabilis]|uniref:maf-like protein n=1 Tax=Radiomyces spectabilis TaxID=64574 RepID=UPI00221F3584|nr:maf-like protein [Radiomyces spectabilis]KAI8379474.1 maf-like protein [Radiomyces spectabilis]